jgi:hypothetical protein
MENRNNRNCRRCNCEEERGEMDSRNCNPCGNGTLGSNVNNDCLADALEDAYNDGYKDGYRDGYEDGNTAGETAGETAGYKQGYCDGYEKAKQEVLDYIRRNRCCRCC